MSATNNVTLFSNGIGHFRRVYKVAHGKETNFSIPFKRDHIGDVAASLQVFGKVRLIKPPSFTPSNANATSLTISQNDAYRSILTSLSGAKVGIATTINAQYEDYVLLGTDTRQTQTSGGAYAQEDYVVLSKEGRITRKNLLEVTDILFRDEGVRTEIDKALKNNFQRIKPDSTMLDISLVPTSEAEEDAVVQYTIPVAAWKMRYSIRQDGENFSLEGAAIIDNNTDEDWDNFQVSVVTGNPISFATDIASVSVPKRRFVQLVDDTALGNVDVEYGQTEAMGSPSVAACSMRAMASPKGGGANRARLGAKMSTANYASFGMNDSEDDEEELESCLEAAQSAGVDSKEVGDFSVFTNKEPITILARKSAIVPMFTVPLKKAGVVLLYKEGNHARRPYRTVKFKNETDFSLGKGKTTIYNSGVFSGECILDTAKPGENRMLPHCLENGVKIVKEKSSVERKVNSLKLSDGVGVIEELYSGNTTYVIENKKDEPFSVALEHNYCLQHAVHMSAINNIQIDFEGVTIKEREKLPDGNGYRVYFELAAKQSLKLEVLETNLVSQTTTFSGHGQFFWFRVNIIDVNNPLSKDKQIIALMKSQAAIDDVLGNINECNERVEELTTQADRIRQNIESVGKNSGQNTTLSNWIKDLDQTEVEIKDITKKQLPELNKKLKTMQKAMGDEIKKISATWKLK